MKNKTLDYLILILIVVLAIFGIRHYMVLNHIYVSPFTRPNNTVQQQRPASYYISLAKKEYNRGDFNSAIRLWEQSLDAKPYHPDLVYHDLGLCYMNLKQYDKAIEQLDKAIELNAKYIDFYYLKAIIYEKANNTTLYRENLEKVISMKDLPNSKKAVVTDSYWRLAELEKKVGNYKKAEEYSKLANNFQQNTK